MVPMYNDLISLYIFLNFFLGITVLIIFNWMLISSRILNTVDIWLKHQLKTAEQENFVFYTYSRVSGYFLQPPNQ